MKDAERRRLVRELDQIKNRLRNATPQFFSSPLDMTATKQRVADMKRRDEIERILVGA